MGANASGSGRSSEMDERSDCEVEDIDEEEEEEEEEGHYDYYEEAFEYEALDMEEEDDSEDDEQGNDQGTDQGTNPANVTCVTRGCQEKTKKTKITDFTKSVN